MVRREQRTPLKEARLNVALTQAEVATAVGVTQSTYQRWETGGIQVPKDRLKRLAKVLGTSPEHILAKTTKPFDLLGIHEDVPEDRTYYGEVALHFLGKGAPLLVPISEASRSLLLRQLETETPILYIESLDNQTLFIRSSAVADVFFSSEAFDTYGPESDAYLGHLGIRPDDSYWLMIEHFECPECLSEDFAYDEIDSVIGRIAWSDLAADRLVAGGFLKEEKREAAIAEAQELLIRATCVTWQLTTGSRRHERFDEDREMYGALVELRDHPEFVTQPICLPTEGYHRSIFINPSAFDYISAPTHRFKNGEMTELEEELG